MTFKPLLLLLLLLTGISALLLGGCGSKPEEAAPTPVAGSNTIPPEAQAAKARSEAEMKARTSAQGQAYAQSMKAQGNAPK